MAKKNLLGGFKFEKLPEISNGLIIPTGNDTRPKQVVQAAPPISETVRQAQQPKTVRQLQNLNFHKLELDSQAFTPMTNVVPTIEDIIYVSTNKPVIVPESEPKFKGLSRRARQRVTHEDLNWEEFGALSSKKERITYLALRGWSLKVQRRGNGLYHYATRYVNRNKKSLYLGSVNMDM